MHTSVSAAGVLQLDGSHCDKTFHTPTHSKRTLDDFKEHEPDSTKDRNNRLLFNLHHFKGGQKMLDVVDRVRVGALMTDVPM